MSTSARATSVGLALTFDDGPNPRGTPALLDVLKRVGARVTFFVIAPNAERHPDLVRRAAEDGHRVELHCDRHVRHSELDEAAIRGDTERALARLETLGVQPALWRVPWGVRTSASETIAAEFGLALVGWDVDTHDWRGDSAEAMFDSTRGRLADRTVVLAHDGIGPGALRQDCAATVAYVALVAEHAAGADLDLVSL
jgi:peptidoglycan/xylan/chitin deacetylase (PgdA/CDA1 family)